jgi:hypothetical protein
MPEQRHTGGCMCGAIRFEARRRPSPSTICYCEYCRHAVGALSVAWLTFRAEDFAFTKGRPASYASSPGVTRTFCPTCGTSLTYTHAGRKEEIDVVTGAMDHPEAYPAEGVVFPSRKVPWDVRPDKPVFHDDKNPEVIWPWDPEAAPADAPPAGGTSA